MYGPSIVRRPAAPLTGIPPVGHYQYPIIGILGSNTLAVSANRLYAVLFGLGAPITVDRVGFEITTGAAGNCRMGVYAHNPLTGSPGALINDCGVGDTTNIAVVEITTSFVAPAGLFWLAGVFDATPTVRRIGVSAVQTSNLLGYSANNETGSNTTNNIANYGSHTYGALPATFPAVTVAGAAHAPKFHIRRG